MFVEIYFKMVESLASYRLRHSAGHRIKQDTSNFLPSLVARATLDRLSKHGIKPENYIETKRIVSFDIPHGLLLFAQRFGHRSIKEVLAQVAHYCSFSHSALA
jgi:hypothetical protein